MHAFRLELILGPVRSGKSDETIRRILAFTPSHRVFVCKSSLDTRDPLDEEDCRIRSRTGASYPAHKIYPGQLSPSLVNGYSVVVIDEAFMLGDDLVKFIEALSKLPNPPYVLLSSLEYASEGHKFPCIEALLNRAWRITHLRAWCQRCGSPAVRSRYTGSVAKTGDVKAGGDSEYEPNCMECFSS